MRIGMGYDVHKLTEDRKLIMGGVEIPHEKGLLGHSDADVLVHAIMLLVKTWQFCAKMTVTFSETTLNAVFYCAKWPVYVS